VGELPIKSDWILRRLLGVILGGIFFYAGVQKYYYSLEFAEAVLAYRLVPEILVGPVAAVIPWLEIAAGAFLVLGVKKRSSLLLLSGFLGVFLLVTAITMARGLKIDCGCGLFFPRQVGWGVMLEDLLFLAWAGGLYCWELSRSVGVSTQAGAEFGRTTGA
jgi:putative oxidoreductase